MANDPAQRRETGRTRSPASLEQIDPARGRETGSDLWPALVWALLHAGFALAFFRGGLGRSLEVLPAALHVPLYVAFAIEALALAVFAWGLAQPLAPIPRVYRLAAPIIISIAFAGLYLDSLVFDSLGFHVNGLVLQVALQPGALDQTGLAISEVVALGAAVFVAVCLDSFAGILFLRRTAWRPRRAWAWAAALLMVWGVERMAMGAMSYYGGDAVRAAGTVLPLQPPVRGAMILGRFLGAPSMEGSFPVEDMPKAGEAMGSLDPASIAFTRKPDVLFLLIESTRADFLTPDVMPHLVRRAEADGRIFTRHYSGAPATHYSLFDIFFGLDAQRRDVILGAGRSPLLFPALKANGYAMSLIASSSVDWMGLTDTVFRDVKDGLLTDLPGKTFHERDAYMIARAREVVASTPKDRPLFLFLFFSGSHFNYSYPESSAVFEPAWDGEGSLSAASVDAEQLKNRAKNALHGIDAKIEELLSFHADQRGGAPLVLVTADHGEEYREHGRVGHGTDLTREQLHVPLVIVDEALPRGVHSGVTGHVDLVPTILSLLGDAHDPGLYSDGLPMQLAPPDGFALATMGWDPRFCAIGLDLKVCFNTLDAGLGAIRLTDPDDRPLAGADARLPQVAPKVLQRLRGGLGQLGRLSHERAASRRVTD